MGRGLSNLQRQILRLTLKKRFVTAGEMIREFFDLQPQELGSKDPAYASAHATLSRTLTRLWQRNLVMIWKNLTHSATGINLTGAGEELAQAIFSEDPEVEG